MKTVYLHIGISKTGSKFIQKALTHNNKLLQEQGYIYPEIRTDSNFPEINGQFIINRNKENGKKVYNKVIKNIIKLSKKYNVILSNEHCWGKFKDVEFFINSLKKKKINVKVIFYLRRQDLHAQSLWAQIVRSGDKKHYLSFSDYIKEYKNYLPYYTKCCMYRELVGKDNIIVRVYEKNQFKGVNHDLLTDFLETIGFKYNKKFEKENKIIHPSLGGIYLEIKNILNGYKEFNNMHRVMSVYLENVAKKRNELASYSENQLFTKQEQIDFLSEYEEDNKKVAIEFLGRKDGVLFKEGISNIKYETDKYKIKDYVDILGEIILMQHDEIENLKTKSEDVTKK